MSDHKPLQQRYNGGRNKGLVRGLSGYSLLRVTRPADRQEDGQGKYFPIWYVRIQRPGERELRTTSREWIVGGAVICARCLDEKRKPEEGEECTCQQPLRKAVTNELAAAMAAYKVTASAGRVAAYQAIHQRPDDGEGMPWGTFLDFYEEHGPDDANRRSQAIRRVLMALYGKGWERLPMSWLTADRWRQWVAMWQAFRAAGNSEKAGDLPKVWEELRTQPLEIQRRARAPWNTTANTALRFVKSMLGEASRGNYCLKIATQMPPMEDLLKMSLRLPQPDGKAALSESVYAEILREVPKLKESTPDVWLFVELNRQTGLRPIEIMKACAGWLEVESVGQEKRYVLSVRTRDDGVTGGVGMGDFSRKAVGVVNAPVSTEVAEMILENVNESSAPAACSIFGPNTSVRWIYKRASKWMRQWVPGGPMTLYMFRKTEATIAAQMGTMEDAARRLGNSEAVVRAHYVDESYAPVLPVVDDDQRLASLRKRQRAV